MRLFPLQLFHSWNNAKLDIHLTSICKYKPEMYHVIAWSSEALSCTGASVPLLSFFNILPLITVSDEYIFIYTPDKFKGYKKDMH